MPFRQKIKKVFGRSSSPSDSGSSNDSGSRKDSSTYQAGEPMPQPKYRGYVDPKHKLNLEKFSFGPSDWRRRSTNSAYSPMGSKMPSRNNSAYKAPHNFFGQVQESSDNTADVADVGSVDDTEKDTPEHCEYATGAKTTTADDQSPLIEADVSKSLGTAENTA